MISKKTTTLLLIILAFFLIAIALSFNPLPQSQSYHHFADQKTVLGIKNAWNVLSNIPFALAGIWGLYLLLTAGKLQFIDQRQRWPWIGFSVGLILTAIGSSYYHAAPDHSRLVWDRLSIMVIFTSYVAALLCERLGTRFGLWLWPILLGIGFSSIFVWMTTEFYGKGDLRFYLAMQVFCVLAPLILLLAPAYYTRSRDIAIIAILYVLAVIFEKLDFQIYQLTDRMVSGHTLKHLTAAFAGVWLIRMLWKRKIIHPNGEI